MSYGCQFVYAPTPPGFRDEDFVHTFNPVNTPGLGQTLAIAATARDIPLVLETDAEFIARGIRLFDANNPFYSFQLKEPTGNFLNSDYTPLWHSFLSGGLVLSPAGALEIQTIPLEPQVECAPGGQFQLYVSNLSGAPLTLAITVSIFGVKRKRYACN